MGGSKGRRVIFLDRDGVINVDNGFVYKWENWQWAAGAIEGLLKLKDMPFALVVVTNQSGVGHGLYKEEDVISLHKKMEEELREKGVKFEAILYCPHRRDAGCGCRKPETGMAKEAEKVVGPVDYRGSLVVGDKIADMEFGKKLGMKTVLIKSKYWSRDELREKPDKIAGSLLEAADFIRENY